MSSETVRLTMAQALVRYLTNQHVARDGVERGVESGAEPPRAGGGSSASPPAWPALAGAIGRVGGVWGAPPGLRPR